MKPSEFIKGLEKKAVPVTLAATLAFDGAALAGCGDNSNANNQPTTPITSEQPGTPNAGVDSPDDGEIRDGQDLDLLNGHTWEEYRRMTENANKSAQLLLDGGESTEILAVAVFPKEVPDGYYIIYRRSDDGKANFTYYSPSNTHFGFPNLSRYNN